jgi:hypothetical protein
MDPTISISEHTEFLDRLGSSLPSEFDHIRGAAKIGRPIVLRFAYRDVPFVGRIERQDATAILHLTGEVGPLPFSAEAARRRRRALITLAAGSGAALTWRVSTHQEITVTGTTTLAQPLTPARAVAGVIQLLLQGDRCLSLLLDVLGDVAELSSPLAV